jgi:protein disulfide-isomerase A6
VLQRLMELNHTPKSNVPPPPNELMVVFAKGSKEPVDYQGARSEIDFVRYLNEHAATHRLVGGALDDTAGRITDMDELAKKLASAANDAEIGYVYKELPDVLSRHNNPYFRYAWAC